MPAFCKLSCFAILLTIITGCAAATSPAPVTMMSATCAPGQRQTMLATKTMPASTTPVALDERAVTHDFAPLFAATCRPDHQFTTFDMITHADLALAFSDARSGPTYHFMAMFGATASPAARRDSVRIVSPADLADAAP